MKIVKDRAFVAEWRRSGNRPARWERATRQELRAKALRVYGGDPPKCACCGETNELFLVLDHVDGGGKRDRDQHKGLGYYRGLITERRSNIRVLCSNCNSVMVLGAVRCRGHESGGIA